MFNWLYDAPNDDVQLVIDAAIRKLAGKPKNPSKPDAVLKKMGYQLSIVRALNKLTQAQMAQELGVTAAVVSQWENGKKPIPVREVCSVYPELFPRLRRAGIYAYKGESYV